MAEPARPRRRHRAGLSRIALACERCRIKKNKCDGASPVCSQCQRAGTECIMVDRLTHRSLPRGHVDALERENEELRARIHELERRNNAFQEYHGISPPWSTTLESAPDGETPSDVTVERATLSQTGGDHMYLGESGGTFFSSLVQKTLTQSGYGHEAASLCNSLRLTRDGHKRHRNRPPTDVSGGIDETVLPSELVLKLVGAYFDHHWPSLPLIHRSTFQKLHLQPFIGRRQQTTSESAFLVLLVLAIGAIDLSRQDRSIRNLPSLCFNTAMEQHFDSIMQQNGLGSIQALLLVSYFALNSSCGIDAWQVGGQAVRAAIAIGLHRQNVSCHERLSLLQREMRKRVFWCAYSIDQNISVALGRPPAIKDADIDVSLPARLTDEDLRTNTNAPSSGLQLPSPTDTSTFIHMIRLRRIRARIQDTFYSVKIPMPESEMEFQRSVIHKDLETWATESPRYNQARVFAFQTNEWFQITYSQSLLLLYRPSPARPKANHEALQICSENAVNLITSYSSLYAKNKMAYTWITVHSLLMASIVMLYTLWVSPAIREQTSFAVVESNIKQCVMLFEVMQEKWSLTVRFRDIVQRFGQTTLNLWQESATQGRSLQPARHEAGSDGHTVSGDITCFGDQSMSAYTARSSVVETCDPEHVLAENTGSAIGLEMLTDLDESIFRDLDMNLPLMMNAFGDSVAW